MNKIFNYLGLSLVLIALVLVGFSFVGNKKMPASLIGAGQSTERKACVKLANQAKNSALKELSAAVKVVDPNAIPARDAAIKSAKTQLASIKKNTTDADSLASAKSAYQTAVKSANQAFNQAIGGKLAKEYITAYNSAVKNFNTAVAACPK